MAIQPLTKPAKGSGFLERKARAREIANSEKREKQIVRKRDKHRCRWPRCEYRTLEPRIEVAHLNDKGMGGDHGERSTADQMICLCFLHHQGEKSLHSGDLEIRPLTTEGANGPCLFISWFDEGQKAGLNPRARSIAETAVGVPEILPND